MSIGNAALVTFVITGLTVVGWNVVGAGDFPEENAQPVRTSLSCFHEGDSYPDGAKICKDGFQHECVGQSGQWMQLDETC